MLKAYCNKQCKNYVRGLRQRQYNLGRQSLKFYERSNSEFSGGSNHLIIAPGSMEALKLRMVISQYYDA